MGKIPESKNRKKNWKLRRKTLPDRKFAGTQNPQVRSGNSNKSEHRQEITLKYVINKI